MTQINIRALIDIADQAGILIMQIYNQGAFDVKTKADQSLLTQADMVSHLFICNALTELFPDIPIISEESSNNYDYDQRKSWKSFFLVDPLDGTKEFVQRNGEFTVNIALIQNSQPILGVVHAPALNKTYYAERNKGAYRLENGEDIELKTDSYKDKNSVRAVISRSHHCLETANFIEKLVLQGKEVISVSAGSALKFGLIAEGLADIYPRFGPTMEWDTAAGHILVSEVGKRVTLVDDVTPLNYNKISLKNPGFIVSD